MSNFPRKLIKKLDERSLNGSLRQLSEGQHLVDFSSNDYLGFSLNKSIPQRAEDICQSLGVAKNGATGSRLLSGNHTLYTVVEKMLCNRHEVEAALVFNSGYDANLGFFSTIPQRGDLVFYDDLIHASIRDGITLGNATSFKFKHNNLDDLAAKVAKRKKEVEQPNTEVYVVTESVFSMDGDSPDLKALVDFCKENNFHLIVDEAHAIGVFGDKGEGLVQQLGLQESVFARVITFGKGIGAHGAAVLGSKSLIQYLTNFCRSFIYTTGLPPHSLAVILAAYESLEEKDIRKLHTKITYFKKRCKELEISDYFLPSNSAVQCCVISGNEEVKHASSILKALGFDVRPILSPTVSKGNERLRFCLHSYTLEKDIDTVLNGLSKLLDNEK